MHEMKMILLLKKHHYGTVIINSDTGKIIDILNIRDLEEIQKVLNKYPNLHTILFLEIEVIPTELYQKNVTI